MVSSLGPITNPPASPGRKGPSFPPGALILFFYLPPDRHLWYQLLHLSQERLLLADEKHHQVRENTIFSPPPSWPLSQHSHLLLTLPCRVAVLDKVTDFLFLLGKLLIVGSVGECCSPSLSGCGSLLDCGVTMSLVVGWVFFGQGATSLSQNPQTSRFSPPVQGSWLSSSSPTVLGSYKTQHHPSIITGSLYWYGTWGIGGCWGRRRSWGSPGSFDWTDRVGVRSKGLVIISTNIKHLLWTSHTERKGVSLENCSLEANRH